MFEERVLDCRASEQEDFLNQSRDVIISLECEKKLLKDKMSTVLGNIIKELLVMNASNYGCIVLTPSYTPQTQTRYHNNRLDYNGTIAHKKARSLLTTKTTWANPKATEFQFFSLKEKGVSKSRQDSIFESFYHSMSSFKKVQEVGAHYQSQKVLNLMISKITLQGIMRTYGALTGTHSIIFHIDEYGRLATRTLPSMDLKRMKRLSMLQDTALFESVENEILTDNTLEGVFIG